jgi:hypothetical protein
MYDSNNKSRKETPPNIFHENPQKTSENHQKRKNEIHKQITKGHKDELQTFHTPRGKFLYKEASKTSSSYPLEDLP